MTWTMWVALVVTIGAVWALVKRYETRLVLITAGLLMAVISWEPMVAFKQFDKSMTNGSLIIAICSAMGFAAVVSLTKCDVHLVALLTKPLKKLGIMLLPACMVVVSLISIAIPSTSGLVAAVGPTVIPLMVRAGFHPAIAAATVVGSITTAYLSPGVSHNAFIAKLANLEVIDFITRFSTFTIGASIAAIILMVVVCLVYRDFRKEGFGEKDPVGEAQFQRMDQLVRIAVFRDGPQLEKRIRKRFGKQLLQPRRKGPEVFLREGLPRDRRGGGVPSSLRDVVADQICATAGVEDPVLFRGPGKRVL